MATVFGFGLGVYGLCVCVRLCTYTSVHLSCILRLGFTDFGLDKIPSPDAERKQTLNLEGCAIRADAHASRVWGGFRSQAEEFNPRP